MGEPWRCLVGCVDQQGRPRQLEISLAEQGGLLICLLAGEVVSLHLHQGAQLRDAVVTGLELSRIAVRHGDPQ